MQICGPGDEFTSEGTGELPYRFRIELDDGAPVRTLTWASPQTIRVGATLLGVGDRVVIREHSGRLLDSIDSLSVRAFGPVELRYLDELVVPVPPLPALSAAAMWAIAATLMFAGLFALRARRA